MKVRRLEDKLDAKFLFNNTFSIRMDEPHFNKKQALLYPGLVCWSNGVSEHIFSESKLVVDRYHDAMCFLKIEPEAPVNSILNPTSTVSYTLSPKVQPGAHRMDL